MIKLFFKNNILFIEETNIKNKKLLSHPLHKIYIKSSLNGSFHEDKYSWINLSEEELIENIEKISTHFKKYNEVVRLDKNCTTILKIKKKRQNEYSRILKKGAESKINFSTQKRDIILKFLSPGFKRDLKSLQLNAVHHLLTVNNGANFSVPGSGKTTIALAYYHILQRLNKVERLFIIGPASCFEPWEYEYKECFGYKPNHARIAGISKVKRQELYLLAEKFEILLTTYHSAARDTQNIKKVLKRNRYMLILDESHYIKRPQGGRIAEGILELAKYSHYRVILTGTPMPNNLEDLWSQFTFLWYDQLPLGRVNNYLNELQVNSVNVSINSVKNKISPLFYRITKKQLDLPAATFHTISCDLSPLQSRIYKGVAARYLLQINEAPSDLDALRKWRRARAIRLLQIASNPTLLRKNCDEFSLQPIDLEDLPLKQGIEHYSEYELPVKYEILKNLVTNIRSNEKVIVWTSFVHNLKMLEQFLKRYNPVSIHGSVPFVSSDEDEFTREKIIKKFKTDTECRLLLANPAACAESISLHRVCHHAIYFDRTFNCAHYLQSLDRIHRLGLASDQKTYYYLIIAKNSIDEIIQNRLTYKMTNMKRVLEDDLPGVVPGYWGENYDDEENIDLRFVEDHIRNHTIVNESKT